MRRTARKIQPLTVSFHNLAFSIKQKKKKNDPKTHTPKVLLHPMSGVIKPGELLAIMGTGRRIQRSTWGAFRPCMLD